MAEAEWIILKMVTDENGEEMLITIEDEAEFDRAADLFEERLEDEFEFTAGDEIVQ